MKDEKANINVEELTKQYEDAKKNFEKTKEKLEQAMKEEEAKKNAMFALQKESRKREVDDAFEHYLKLRNEYIEDYGSYKTGNIDNSIFISPFWHSYF